MILKETVEQLQALSIEYAEELSLKLYSTFRIGGHVELALFPDTEEKLIGALSLLREAEIPFAVLGNGSNVLFGDGRLEGAIVFTKNMTELRVCKSRIDAACGVSLAALASAAADHSLDGLAFAKGIPGTVGGAVFMNAGAYGGAISDVLTESRAWDTEHGELLTIVEHDFGYRASVYMQRKELICLGATFALREGDRETIVERMRELAVCRREKQPLEYPSAGSYFKRPEGHFAGKLIEDCGLKGYSVGGAEVSTKHAGFLINRGDATAEDVLRLEEEVKNEVYRRFGVTLEREVRVIETLQH